MRRGEIGTISDASQKRAVRTLLRSVANRNANRAEMLTNRSI